MEKLQLGANDHLLTLYEQTRNCFSTDGRGDVWMMNHKHDNWPVSQILHVSVLNFYCLQAKIFLKNGFVTYFLMKTGTFHQWFSIHTLGEKRPAKQKKIHFPRDKCFFVKFLTLHISKINSFLDLKRNTIIRQKLRTTWYNGKLHGATTLEIRMLWEPWNSFR